MSDTFYFGMVLIGSIPIFFYPWFDKKDDDNDDL